MGILNVYSISRLGYFSKSNMSLVVLYGSETGTAKEAAETIVYEALDRGYKDVTLLPIDGCPLSSWSSLSCPIIFTCATTGIGEMPATMQKSWAALRMSDAPSMTGLTFAVFGLGDSSYEKYNYAAKMFHNRLVQLGAAPLLHRGLGDDQDRGSYEEQMTPWSVDLWNALGALLSGESQQQQGLPPFWKVTTSLVKSDPSVPSPATPTESVIRAEVCDAASVIENRRLSSEKHFQDVRHIEIETKMKALPGDAIGIYPVNPASEVDKFLKLLRLEPSTLVTISPILLKQQQSFCFFGKPIRAIDLFTHYLDICGIASRRFLKMLSFFAGDKEVQERLQELSSATFYDEYIAYCYREKRSYVDVLADFFQVQPSLEAIVNQLRPLRPRYFSASGVKAGPNGSVVSLTVAVLALTTPYGQKRFGLCSTYLKNAVKGTLLQSLLRSGNIVMPPSPTPLILVGPGTGIAPLRYMIQSWHEAGAKSELHLFAGFRNAAHDYLYEEEWLQLTKTCPNFHLHVAFSRDGVDKVYVQHLIFKEAAALGPLIVTQGAYIVVAGNSKQMPADVERAFRNVIEAHLPEEDVRTPEKYVAQMRSSGRYVNDCWSA